MRANQSLSQFRQAVTTLAAIALTLSPIGTSARERTDSEKPKTVQSSITSQSPAAPKAAMMAMPLVAPVFLEDQEFNSILVLVNISSEDTYATVTLRSLTGSTIIQQKVPLGRSSQTRVLVRDLLRVAISSETKGSIIVEQSPDLMGMVVLAQLSITYLSSSHASYIDEELAMPDPTMGSQILRGVARNRGEPIRLAISSLSQATQEIQVDCLYPDANPTSKTIELSANATVISDACTQGQKLASADENETSADENENSRKSGAVGIRLVSNARPGQFAAFGLRRRRAKGDSIFGCVPFDDPKLAASSTTVFAGLPVGAADLLGPGLYKPYMVVANFSLRSAHVTISFSRTSGVSASTTTSSNTVVGEFSLQPQRTKILSLAELDGDPGLRNSFVIASDAAPGDLAVSAAAGTPGGGDVELLAKDAEQRENGGAHPWSIAGGNESTLLIFNHTDKEQRTVITIPGGTAIWQKLIKLGPFETSALSISQLINNKVPDERGQKLPSGLFEGEITWTMGDPKTITGRLLVSNSITAMARNFSCAWYPTLCGASVSPTSGAAPVGDSGTQFLANASICGAYYQFVCYGQGSASGITPSYSWYQSGGSGTISVPTSCSGNAFCGPTGSSVGAAQLTAQVTYGSCAYYPVANVNVFQVQVTNADIVGNTITVVMSSPSTLSGTLTLTVNGPGISYSLFQGVESSGSVNFSFHRTQLPSGAYTYVKATWNVSGYGTATATANVNFDVLGTYRHSQYNSPQESACTVTPSTAWVINLGNCTFTQTTLRSDFISQVGINGSGISQSYGNLQFTTRCANYPNGANSGNSFAQVATINGSCLQPVVAGQTVAVNPNPNPGNATWNCTDTVQLVTTSDANQAQKSVNDYCPACSGGFNGTSGHIDDYASSSACSGHAVGDYGNFLTIRLRAQ